MNEVEPSTDELLVALRAPPERPDLPEEDGKERRDAILRYFLFDYLGLKKPARRGTAGVPSIQACSLYRMYAEWHQAAFLEKPLTPRQFCLSLNRVGVKRRRIYKQDEQYWLLVFIKEGSRRLVRWLEDNPDPFGWPQEFAAETMEKK